MGRDLIANGGALPFRKPVEDFDHYLEIPLLGACFNDPAVIDAVMPIVGPSDFAEPFHGRIFDAFIGRRWDGGKIDSDFLTDLVTDLVLDTAGEEFVENFVDAIVHPAIRPKLPRQFAIKIRARAKDRAGVAA